jgi:hypothetical protein
MDKVTYVGDVEKYLLTLENLNIKAEVTGIAWRTMVERRLPLEALRRLSLQKYELDSDWLAAVREATKNEEAFKEQQRLFKGNEPTEERKPLSEDAKVRKKTREKLFRN